MNQECETLEQVDATERDHLAEVDLYKTLARLEHMTDGATALEAADALRLACLEGRLYGLSYGYKGEPDGADDGPYIGCALAHLGHTADPVLYERDGQAALCSLMDYPQAGYVLEEYVMYTPRGARPEDNQYVANLVNWLDNYLGD